MKSKELGCFAYSKVEETSEKWRVTFRCYDRNASGVVVACDMTEGEAMTLCDMLNASLEAVAKGDVQHSDAVKQALDNAGGDAELLINSIESMLDNGDADEAAELLKAAKDILPKGKNYERCLENVEIGDAYNDGMYYLNEMLRQAKGEI